MATKADRDALAKGAEAIKGAAKKTAAKKTKKAATGLTVTPPPEPLVIPPVTRDIKEILAEHVTVNAENTGVTLAEGTPLNESIAILDYFQGVEGHVGFMIGDIINQSERIYGGKWHQAMVQTGRAVSTLRGYLTVARAIPPERRKALLSFTLHREVARLSTPEKQLKVLDAAEEKAKAGKAPSVLEVRATVLKVEPPKKKTPKKPSKKSSKKGAKVKPPYEPTAEESAQLDEITEALQALVYNVEKGDFAKWIIKIDNARKRELLKLLKPIERLTFQVEKHTGY